MLEAAAASLLAKACEVLFKEGLEIVRKHIKRKGINRKEPKLPKGDVIQDKESMKHLQVNPTTWLEHEAEIKHLLELSKIYSRNYRIAEDKYARYGKADVRPVIINDLEEAERGMVETMRKLQATLSTVYGKKIIIPELENIGEE